MNSDAVAFMHQYAQGTDDGTVYRNNACKNKLICFSSRGNTTARNELIQSHLRCYCRLKKSPSADLDASNSCKFTLLFSST